MNLFNGGNILLADIPVLTMEEFRQEVLYYCHSGARLQNLFASPENSGKVRLYAILGFDEEAQIRVQSTLVSSDNLQYQSLTPVLLAAQNFEREIAEQWAVVPLGHPWLKPLRYHSNYRGVEDLWADIMTRPIPGAYPFYGVDSDEVHQVAVGPVHAGIIEPGHFRFQCHGEEILHLEIQLGYQHRGIEPMLTGNDLKRSVLLSESIAGDTSIGHSTAFCEVVESLTGCVVPPRAQVIRAVALELERLANHVGDLGAMGMDAGFLPSSSYFGRMRGDYLNLLLALTGNRFGKGLCRPGGVLFDLDQTMSDDFCNKLVIYKKEFEDVSELLFSRPSVLARFENIGVISPMIAKQLGLVGPVARASQQERDVRIEYSSGIWQFNHVPISLSATGDVYARALVRRQEVLRSLDFLLKILPTLPKSSISSPVGTIKPNAFAVSLVEGWRGEIMHVGISNDQGGFSRYKVKDPSFHNWFGLSVAMRGQQISDFPLCNKSFNLSYCGHDL
ncbi:MAG: NADH-quinone oxidoreductase subunit C [Candidatus Omnitrophica bacterium]|nr:NADH-quinone oxidoreductase subunit C [Candidatus Omnitrophota bacterium]